MPELGGTPAPATPASAAPSVGTLHYSMPSSGLPAFTAQAMEMLRQTRPWVRFMGIMLYIIAGLSAAGGIVLFVLLITTGGRNTDGWLGFLYVPFALLYLVPGIYLNRYASRIAQLQQFNREDMLEEALAAQKSFWKFCGIALIVIIALYIALAAVMMVIAMM